MSESKPQRLRSHAYALCFASALPGLQADARKLGYALAVHGSMATDFDLIAVPWTDAAATAEELVETIRLGVDGVIRSHASGEHDHNPAHRPHGRRAWSIYLNADCKGPYIDLSVMATEPPAAGGWIAVEHACPDEGEWTLFYSPEVGREVGWYRGNGIWRMFDLLAPDYAREVGATFWMQVPVAPPTLSDLVA